MSEKLDSVSLPFPQELLSGYLDEALTQQDEQRVRVQLEESASARRLLEELRIIREASMTTRTDASDDRQWGEVPKATASRWSKRAGFTLVLVWLAVISGLALWQIAIGSEAWWEKAAIFGGFAGVALLFFSVLQDRLRASRTDRYREVEK